MIWLSFQTLFRCVYYLQVVECVCTRPTCRAGDPGWVCFTPPSSSTQRLWCFFSGAPGANAEPGPRDPGQAAGHAATDPAAAARGHPSSSSHSQVFTDHPCQASGLPGNTHLYWCISHQEAADARAKGGPDEVGFGPYCATWCWYVWSQVCNIRCWSLRLWYLTRILASTGLWYLTQILASTGLQCMTLIIVFRGMRNWFIFSHVWGVRFVVGNTGLCVYRSAVGNVWLVGLWCGTDICVHRFAACDLVMWKGKHVWNKDNCQCFEMRSEYRRV